MAKKPRMGRNLDALLGGAARERTGSRSTEQKSTDRPESNSKANAESASTEHDDASQDATAEQVDANDPPQISKDSRPESNTETGKVDNAVSPLVGGVSGGDQLILLDIEKIRRGTYQPRRLFDPDLLQELADSIKSEGLIQPIIVRAFADGYELVAGERRWRAAQLAGIDRIPAIVRDMQDQSVAAVALIENIQRKDLNPLEEAAAFERLCDEFGMTHKAVAQSVGRSRASVSNLLRLLELHEEVKVLVDRGELEMGHARALLAVPKPRQFTVAQKITQQGMSVRAVEKYIRSLDEEGNDIPSAAAKPALDPDIERLSQKLSETLGAAVNIQHRASGGGKLQITYSSVSELQGILAHIK